MERVALENLLDAWNKKNFSPQEKIAEKGKREGMGIS
jgi:hypothetical protein